MYKIQVMAATTEHHLRSDHLMLGVPNSKEMVSSV
jgi:hypothetical protein